MKNLKLFTRCLAIALVAISGAIKAGGSHGAPIKGPAKSPIIKWMSPDDAYKAYKRSPKPLFIDVYTDWCGWCKRMDQTTFQDEVIAAYINQNFYPVKFNAETRDTVRFLEKVYFNSQADYVKGVIAETDSLILLYKDSLQKAEEANKAQYSKQVNELVVRKAQIARKASRTSHDFAIDIMNRSMSYPTFVVLFDSLKQNFPIKGYQKPNQLLSNLSFFNERAWKNTNNLQGYMNLFMNTFASAVDYPNRRLPKANDALAGAKKNGKKTILLLTNDQLYTSQLMEKGSFFDPAVRDFLNQHFNYGVVEITEKDSIALGGYSYKNVNGIHQLPVSLMNQRVTFPSMVLLNEQQELVMPIPGFFLPGDLLPALHFLKDEVYKTKETYPQFRKRYEKEQNGPAK